MKPVVPAVTENEVIPVGGHMDTTFFQQNGADRHTVNVILDVWHDMFGSCALSN